MAECSCDTEDDKSLTSIFDDAIEMYEKVMKSDEPINSTKLQGEITKCIQLLEKATHLINAAGVFSSNETVDEIPSQNIKYLLIPGFLGSLLLKVQTSDRLNTLETAEIYFKDFIKRAQEYEIVGSFKLDDTDENSSAQGTESKPLDLQQLALQRNEKIKKYREQKEAEAELQRLKTLMLKDDDEICRNYYLTYVKTLIGSSMQELNLIKTEKPLAKHFAEARAGGTSFAKPEKKKHPVQPFKPIIITRNELQKKVFGAGYPSLPTMTVDEFYQQRVAEGIFPAQGSKHGKVLQEMTDPEVVKQEEEKEEIEKEDEIERDDPKYLEKTRSMDEFKDTHKRGWGNRMNKS